MKLFENRSKTKIIEYYSWFSQNADDLLSKSKTILKKNDLEFSIKEIDEFGEHVLRLINNGLSDEDEYDLINVFIAYYGKAWMHYFGGIWYFSTKKSEMGYGFPQIIEYGPLEEDWVAINPLDYYTYTLIRDGKPLSRIISRELDYYISINITNYKRN